MNPHRRRSEPFRAFAARHLHHVVLRASLREFTLQLDGPGFAPSRHQYAESLASPCRASPGRLLARPDIPVAAAKKTEFRTKEHRVDADGRSRPPASGDPSEHARS